MTATIQRKCVNYIIKYYADGEYLHDADEWECTIEEAQKRAEWWGV